MSIAINLIIVGQLKDKHLKNIEDGYLKRIKNPKFTITEVKSNAEDKESEAKLVWKKIQDISKNTDPYIVLLDENGKHFDSLGFSKWLYKLVEQYKSIFFVIGGAEGHGDFIRQKAKAKFSLSTLTFPHRLARLIFIEQYYRAQTIYINHPYHN